MIRLKELLKSKFQKSKDIFVYCFLKPFSVLKHKETEKNMKNLFVFPIFIFLKNIKIKKLKNLKFKE